MEKGGWLQIIQNVQKGLRQKLQKFFYLLYEDDRVKRLKSLKALFQKQYLIQMQARIKQDKTAWIVAMSMTLILVLGSWFQAQYVNAQMVDVYAVKQNDRILGWVSSPKVVEQWINHRLKRESLALGGAEVILDPKMAVQFERKRIFQGKIEDEQVLETLSQNFQTKVMAQKITINGKTIGYVKSVKQAEKVIAQVAEHITGTPLVFDAKQKKVHIAPLAQETHDQELSIQALDHKEKTVRVATAATSAPPDEKLVGAQIKSDIAFESEAVDPDLLTDEATLADLLATGGKEPQIYVIEAGDTLSGVAQKFHTTVQSLLDLNVGLQEDSVLQIGQQLIVSPTQPEIVIETETEKIVEERIPYTTKTIEDNTMYKGQSKIQQTGQDGKKQIRYRLTRENGIITAQEVVDEQVLTPPREQIVIKGTKTPPTVPTGQFIWPTKGGYITSGYGMRWGKMHPAIDISGVYDRTIMAADNGKVVFAGRSGAYGNLVKISHGNGYETWYAHLSSISVSSGQQVAKGQKIGVMGDTGHATGVHLHFEIHLNGKALNPAKFY